MKILSTLDKWLGIEDDRVDTEPPSPSSEESVVAETPKPPSQKTLALQEAEAVHKKWLDSGIAVSLRDFKDRKAGEQFKIESVDLEKSSRDEDDYWLHMKISGEAKSELVTLGCVSFGYTEYSEGKKWHFINFERSDFLVTLEESQIPDNQIEIEAWKNPELKFKIRQKEGKPCYTVWFSHNGFTRGQFWVVRSANSVTGYPVSGYDYGFRATEAILELDSLETAKEIVNILRKRTKIEEIARFERQFEDVAGEFYTVETIP